MRKKREGARSNEVDLADALFRITFTLDKQPERAGKALKQRWRMWDAIATIAWMARPPVGLFAPYLAVSRILFIV